jgi:hypothetical protein
MLLVFPVMMLLLTSSAAHRPLHDSRRRHPRPVIAVGNARFPHAWFEDLAASLCAITRRRETLSPPRAIEAERKTREQLDGPPLAVLGVIDAALGRKEEGLREAAARPIFSLFALTTPVIGVR